MAGRFGADLVLRPGEVSAGRLRELVAERSQAGGADAVIETAGVASALSEGLGLLRPAGRYVSAGLVLPAAPVELDASLNVRGMLTVRGVHNYHPRHLARALDFVARQLAPVPLAELVHARMPLDAIDEVFEDASARRGVRTGILP